MGFAAVFAIVVGILMVGQWSLTIARKQVPGTDDDPVAGRGRMEMGFHWVAEFATALALIAGGSGLLLGVSWGTPVILLALGMLIYSVVNSPGFFAQQGQWAMVGLFALLLVLALVSAGLVVAG